MFTRDTLEKDRELQERWEEKYQKLHKDLKFKATTRTGVVPSADSSNQDSRLAM
ncbi:MAG: hypothetical protein V2A69_05110 [Pseudomonadota bacterium]